MGRPYFILFNNKSSLDLGLKVISRPNIPLPQKQYETHPVLGIDGEYFEDLETFEDIEIKVSFNFIERTNIHNKIRQIAQWLNVVADNDYKLTFADDDNYYYKVKKISCSDIERQLRVKGIFTVTFTCECYKYYVYNDLITITNNNFVIYSDEFVYNSRPTIKVYGSGNITLTINSADIQLKEIDSNIIIDSAINESYNSTVKNLNDKINGKFPLFQSGINTISWIGNVAKIEITPNWRSL